MFNKLFFVFIFSIVGARILPEDDVLNFRSVFFNTHRQSGIQACAKFFTNDFQYIEGGVSLGLGQFFNLLSRNRLEDVFFNRFLKAFNYGNGVTVVNSYNQNDVLIRVFTFVKNNQVEGGYQISKVETK